VVYGYTKPIYAHDWDKASLLQYQSFGISTPDLRTGCSTPVLIVQGKQDQTVPRSAALRLNVPPDRHTTPAPSLRLFVGCALCQPSALCGDTGKGGAPRRLTVKPRIADALPLPWRSQEALGDRAEYVELDRCGHLPMDECPDRLNAVVLPFVSRVMRRSGRRVAAQLSATKPVVVERSSDAAAGASSST
jgi:hypothetical protein